MVYLPQRRLTLERVMTMSQRVRSSPADSPEVALGMRSGLQYQLTACSQESRDGIVLPSHIAVFIVQTMFQCRPSLGMTLLIAWVHP